MGTTTNWHQYYWSTNEDDKIHCSANKEDGNLTQCYNEVISVQRRKLHKTDHQTQS